MYGLPYCSLCCMYTVCHDIERRKTTINIIPDLNNTILKTYAGSFLLKLITVLSI